MHKWLFYSFENVFLVSLTLINTFATFKFIHTVI